MRPWTRRAVPTLILAIAVLCALLLALPGETITTTYVNDLFIFIDGAHRIASGQVPNRDFHTALGPLTFYLPALGYWLTGNLGGAMPVGMALLVLVLAPAMAHIFGSRLKPVIAIPFGAFVILIVAVPINLGESVRALSFAMFYNRIGWAALATLLVMYLRPEEPRPRQVLLDAICAAVLTLVMVYTKVTYGLVALAFLTFMLLDPRQWRWAALTMCIAVVTGLTVEAFWQSSMAHVADLRLASKVSGVRSLEDLALGFLKHLADYAMFATVAVLALWRTRSFRDLLFFGFCAVPGLLIMIQNSQPWGIITIHAGAVVAAEMLVRSEAQREHALPRPERAKTGDRLPSLAAGAPFVLLALVLPTTVHCVLALGLHATLAATRSGEAFGLPNFDRIRLAQLWSPADPFSRGYLTSLQDGAQALSDLPVPPSRVSVLDFVSPFSAGLGLAPPRGDSAWLHWGRNVNEAHFVPPEQLLGEVRVLMLPKWGINSGPLVEVYGAYIGRAFEPVRETDLWTVHLRRERRTDR